MKKSRVFKILVLAAALTMMFSMNVLAAEKETDSEEAELQSLASYVRTGEVEDSFSVAYSFFDGIERYVNFSVSCRFTAVWDEGYGGHIAEAEFGNITDADIEGQAVPMQKTQEEAIQKGDIYVMYYIVNNRSDFKVRVEVKCDEWGEVTLWAYWW